MYSPQLGRFLQIDPIGYYDSMNLYQYCGNNPGNYTDPLGLFSSGVPPSLGPQVLPPTAEWLFQKWLEKHEAREREQKGKCKKAIIGEDMKRILLYMAMHPKEKFEAFFWDDIWPLNVLIPDQVLMDFNKMWIQHMMGEGREIIDIGRSPRRRNEWKPISKFYRMERMETDGYYRKRYDYFPIDVFEI